MAVIAFSYLIMSILSVFYAYGQLDIYFSTNIQIEVRKLKEEVIFLQIHFQQMLNSILGKHQFIIIVYIDKTKDSNKDKHLQIILKTKKLSQNPQSENTGDMPLCEKITRCVGTFPHTLTSYTYIQMPIFSFDFGQDEKEL